MQSSVKSTDEENQMSSVEMIQASNIAREVPACTRYRQAHVRVWANQKTQLLDDSSGYLCDAGVGNQLQCLDLTSLLTIFSINKFMPTTRCSLLYFWHRYRSFLTNEMSFWWPLLYIYIYAFNRRFYPKRLTIAFRLYIMCSLGIEPTTFCAADVMLYHWATQEQLLVE